MVTVTIINYVWVHDRLVVGYQVTNHWIIASPPAFSISVVIAQMPGLQFLQSSCNLCSGDRCCWAVRVGFLCIVEVGVEVLVFRYRRLVEESWKVVMPPVNALLFDGEHVAISVFDKMAQLVGICFCLL